MRSKTKIIAWLAFMPPSICAWPTTQAIAGANGPGEGGGGGAVACFADAKIAKNAVVDGLLTPKGRTQIQSLELVDYYEFKTQVRFSDPEATWDLPRIARFKVIAPELGNNSYYWHATDQLYHLSPFLSYRLNQAQSWINGHVQKFPSGIRRVDDVGGDFDQHLRPECQRVQVFYRHSQSHDGLNPKVTLDVDPDLFSRLGTSTAPFLIGTRELNQAMAAIHEQLYVLGTELHQLDSSQVRLINAVIFSDVWDRVLATANPRHNLGYSGGLFSIFGNANPWGQNYDEYYAGRDQVALFDFFLSNTLFSSFTNLFLREPDDVENEQAYSDQYSVKYGHKLDAEAGLIPDSILNMRQSFTALTAMRAQFHRQLLSHLGFAKLIDSYLNPSAVLQANLALPGQLTSAQLSNEEAFFEVLLEIANDGSDAENWDGNMHVEKLLVPPAELRYGAEPEQKNNEELARLCERVSTEDSWGSRQYMKVIPSLTSSESQRAKENYYRLTARALKYCKNYIIN